MRKSGILIHLSSLSSPYGIGTMGKAAYEFVDFLHASGQRCWQLLPLGPTSYGDSPYQSYCTFAGNPYFIDLDILKDKGLLKKSDYHTMEWGSNLEQVDYGILYKNRCIILRKAVSKFMENPPIDFERFCEKQASWLGDFALFMALKEANGGIAWMEWEAPIRNRDEKAICEAKETYKIEILFWKTVQYFFFEQWKALKAYANERDIEIVGDLPIYMSLDSVDTWARPELFQLDENKIPKEVTGCPPDGFSSDGQRWGNPLYNWEYMETNGYEWWVWRIQYLFQMYDILRIDHFRGFDSYYAIPFQNKTAKHGHWKQGPGMKLFHAVEKAIGKRNIIAEDLGHVTDSVKQLLIDSGFPGMKVLEFAFDSRNAGGSEYLPHNYIKNCVAYTGTHDNDTILGWFANISKADEIYAKEYLRIQEGEALNWSMMEALWGSVAELTIVQAQDILGLGSEARMNTPSTVARNWCWRAKPEVFTQQLSEQLKRKIKIYGRCS